MNLKEDLFSANASGFEPLAARVRPQTLDEIMPYFNEKEIVSCLEEPRISEQQIGNFQNVQQVLGEFLLSLTNGLILASPNSCSIQCYLLDVDSDAKAER